MEYTVKYANAQDRREKADEQNVLGRRMLYDHFDAGFERRLIHDHFEFVSMPEGDKKVFVEGKGISGTMVFTDESELQVAPAVNPLEQMVRDLTARVEALEA